ncbi:MAG: restriction endonuclease subunit S [Methyloversatilis sp.]|uniref:restriction endonuclease subunit S n=1 Tax=Methyloversatilis sp. TaxID=2569862 RepID=UPI0027369F56|nr:restriction endonuclease subunit S [Methyloversatilis sp.]MDP3874323.1 restriction endonuclease subunit S [Methyloversatilis sp.]
MSFEWRSTTVEELISENCLEVGDGYRAKNSELSKFGIPFARAGNINDGFQFLGADCFPLLDLWRVGSKVSRPGDVVFTSKGTVGRFALVEAHSPQFVYSPQLCYWRSLDPNKLLPAYLYYWMSSKEFLHQVGYLKGQTDMADYVSLRDQRRMTVSVPPLSYQKEVVERLKPLDDRIALLRETNATLEAIAQALFKSWFVDFDPVRARMEGRPPEGMDDATAALFPDSFEESELGWVPKGWKPRRLDSFIEFAYGKALKAGDRITGDVPVYGSGGVTGHHNQSLVNGPSVIVGRKGTVGSLFWEDRPFFPIDTVFFVSSSEPMTYCYYLLETLGLSEMNTDAAVPGLNRNNVYRLKVLGPNAGITAAFDSVVGVIRRRIFSNNQQAQTLATLRDTLLPRLISGQLRLPEAEAMAPETA